MITAEINEDFLGVGGEAAQKLQQRVVASSKKEQLKKKLKNMKNKITF